MLTELEVAFGIKITILMIDKIGEEQEVLFLLIFPFEVSACIKLIILEKCTFESQNVLMWCFSNQRTLYAFTKCRWNVSDVGENAMVLKKALFPFYPIEIFWIVFLCCWLLAKWQLRLRGLLFPWCWSLWSVPVGNDCLSKQAPSATGYPPGWALSWHGQFSFGCET